MWSVTVDLVDGGAITYENISACDALEAEAIARMHIKEQEPSQRVKRVQAAQKMQTTNKLISDKEIAMQVAAEFRAEPHRLEQENEILQQEVDTQRRINKNQQQHIRKSELGNESLSEELDRLYDMRPLEEHDSPDNCPTYYDGCHCSIATLKYNIDRAENAEKELSKARNNEKIWRDCLDHWQDRFMALNDAWNSGDNNDALAGLERFLKAKDGDLVRARAEDIDRAKAHMNGLLEQIEKEGCDGRCAVGECVCEKVEITKDRLDDVVALERENSSLCEERDALNGQIRKQKQEIASLNNIVDMSNLRRN